MPSQKIQAKDSKQVLIPFVPDGMADVFVQLLQPYPVKVKIVRPRKSASGSYRKTPNGQHLITLNCDLNKYAFALTFLHEIAHLQTANTTNKRLGHGKLWKKNYAQLIEKYILHNPAFPADILSALQSHVQNITSTDAIDIHLTRTLQKYDSPKPQATLLPTLEEIPYATVFVHDKKLMRKEKLLRKYYLCKELSTNKLYRCHPLMRVEVRS
ncbi:MAG: SprT-like domain-containing protein [Bacteroidales bacterium]|jgi:hypothetical protein|nr:SprT-like domain-containing protein [Bacteroidales bacterium]